MSALRLEDVSVRFGGLQALDRVSFTVPAGAAVALIGPNGAGKTTCFNVTSGFQAPSSGRVLLGDDDVSDLPAHRRSGLGRTFQITELFGEMTARDNVLLSFDRDGAPGLLRSGLARRAARRIEREHREQADELLTRMGLEGIADRRAASLSLGQQRLVELARATAQKPRLLLLDESASGLAGSEIDDLLFHVDRLRQGGCALLAVEHDMRFVQRIADELVVLNFGEVIFRGSIAAGLNDDAVMAAYLGTVSHADR